MQKRLENKSTIKLSRNSGSFTLVELLIATLIFSIITVIAASFFITVLRAHRRADLEDYLYSEARLMMEKLVMEVRRGTISYEEYHSRLVEQGGAPDEDYGDYYQYYGEKFWHPGTNNVGDASIRGYDPLYQLYGSLCNDGSSPYDGICVRLRETMDINMGFNYWDSSDPSLYNAFCNRADRTPSGCDAEDNHIQYHLYLVNDAGNLRTFIVREKIKATPDEYAVSIVQMEGFDYGTHPDPDSTDAYEGDDIIDTWRCTSKFNCTYSTSPNTPHPEDVYTLDDSSVLHASDFVPVTPLDLNVADLKFIIAPLEDPHKAFTEDDVQIHPYVTIILTVQPSEEAWGKLGLATPPEITLQTTVSSRVYRQIESFKPPL